MKELVVDAVDQVQSSALLGCRSPQLASRGCRLRRSLQLGYRCGVQVKGAVVTGTGQAKAVEGVLVEDHFGMPGR